MENLKVGDKVYNINNKWGKAIYNISTVIRVTKTLAILENGIRIKINSNYRNEFEQYGNPYIEWQISTDEIMEKIKNIQSQKAINKWFNENIFTDDQKKVIYHQFKNQ